MFRLHLYSRSTTVTPKNETCSPVDLYTVLCMIALHNHPPPPSHCGAEVHREPWPTHSWGFQITHNDAPHSVGLLWTSDELVAVNSTWQHTRKTNIQAADGIRTHYPSKRAAADLYLRPHGHWDHLYDCILEVCTFLSTAQRGWSTLQ